MNGENVIFELFLFKNCQVSLLHSPRDQLEPKTTLVLAGEAEKNHIQIYFQT
jgi:hypothetical protein